MSPPAPARRLRNERRRQTTTTGADTIQHLNLAAVRKYVATLSEIA
jgi:hypothetical protein